MKKRKVIASLLSFTMVLSGMPFAVQAKTVEELTAESFGVADSQNTTDAESATDAGNASLGTPGVDYIDGEVIACVRGGEKALASGKARAAITITTETLMDNVSDPEEMGSTEESMGTEGQGMALQSVDTPVVDNRSDVSASLVLVTGASTEELIAYLEENPAVEYAEPNYILELESYNPPIEEPGYIYQWGLDNQITPGSTTGADIHVVEAWNYTEPPVVTTTADESTSDNTPVVAVLDTGVDYNHEDLQGVMWDDGLNYPTLAAMGGGQYGYSADAANPSDPMDTIVGHGTHCAGVIAAQWGNTEGIAGVSPTAEIMAVKIFNDSGKLELLSAIRGFAYVKAAKEAGVNIVATNNSWGSSDYTRCDLYSISAVVQTIGELGVVSCFAAGNSSNNLDEASVNDVCGNYAVKVSAIDSEGYLASFSTYGQQMCDVAAPGTQILSTTSLDTSKTALVNHQMQPQYLPQMQESSDSYIYEDFEDDIDDITISLIDSNGQVVEDAMIETCSPGYASDNARQISLDAIGTGEQYAIQLVIPAERVAQIDPEADLYMAFAGSTDAPVDSILWAAERSGENRVWIESTQPSSDGQYLPIYLECLDSNWNQLSGKIRLPQTFLDSRDSEGNISILMRKGKKETESYFRIDNFGIGNAASGYYYSDGTSMAAPMAAGEAALLASVYGGTDGTDGAEAAEIAARIRGGVNRTSPDEKLAEATVSGGYLDAAKACTDPVPVIASQTSGEGELTLYGYFFGEDPGTVSIDGTSVTVQTWEADRISCDLPEGCSGNPEVRVTRADGEWGRNFLTISPDYRGYTNLSAPDFVYEMSDGILLYSAEFLTYRLGAAGNYIMRLSGSTMSFKPYLELYQVDADCWTVIEAPAIPGIEDMEYDGLAAGKDKFYLTMHRYVDDQIVCMVAVYTPEEALWTYQEIDNCAGAEALVYKDQLLLIGGYDMNGEVKDDVRIINPVTGETEGTLPKLPVAGYEMCAYASGDMLIVRGGYNAEQEWNYSDQMVYDGETWTTYEDVFFYPGADNPYFDSQQALDYAVGARDGGLIVAGPVANLAEENMCDTWQFDASLGTWAQNTEVLYSSHKTMGNAGVSLNNQFYVLGRQADINQPMVFRATPISYTGPTANPGEAEPTPTDTPTPTPSETVTPTPSGTVTPEPSGTVTPLPSDTVAPTGTEAPTGTAAPTGTTLQTTAKTQNTAQATTTTPKTGTTQSRNATTGDHTPFGVWMVLLGVTGIGAALAFQYRRKRKS